MGGVQRMNSGGGIGGVYKDKENEVKGEEHKELKNDRT